ncbi:MAG: Abi family protein [Firmicutes bacterium]|jgi:abortive infection bacteriophage resistance protein|nr:Abi family protein [Bacillota bacterium]
MTKPFDKKPLTHKEQVNLLRNRGMIISEEHRHLLQHLNYYRLSAYWKPFETDKESHQLQSGVNFLSVLARYNFDCELRLHLFNAVSHIEISFRANFAYQMSINHGPHAHLDESLWRSEDIGKQNLCELQTSSNDRMKHTSSTFRIPTKNHSRPYGRYAKSYPWDYSPSYMTTWQLSQRDSPLPLSTMLATKNSVRGSIT